MTADCPYSSIGLHSTSGVALVIVRYGIQIVAAADTVKGDQIFEFKKIIFQK